MRAREFTINVPINIRINGDEDPEVSMPGQDTEAPKDDTELQQNPIMVAPLQQDIEIKKAQLGKESPVIDKLTQDHSIGQETPNQDDVIQRIKELMAANK